jgi:organic hydroperoxide reductase OsmC/OhrA
VASASPHVVPAPLSDPGGVDPEEAFVAALSSCHMLWFLSIAAKHGFTVDSYRDDAVGYMEKNPEGRLAIMRVVLRPRIQFSGVVIPESNQIDDMHEEAHRKCYIANSVRTLVVVEPGNRIQADPVLGELSTLVARPAVTAKLAPILARLEGSLSASPELPQAWEPIPLDALDADLPSSIKSCWIFVLRAGGVFGAEKHPNSHQRSIALKGSALFELYVDDVWTPHPIDSAGSCVEARSISIPAGTWHRIKIGAQNLASLSFHTVVASELIEETPVAEDLSVTRRRLYHA